MNDINEMPPKCQYCPYWEVCDYSFSCPTKEQLATKLQQTCNQLTTDTISRQAAISAVNTALFPKINTAKEAEKAIKDLPSVQPKHGYWIESHEHIYIANGVKEWTNWYCSECDAPNDKPINFCPNCGARMENSDG